jgi:hypothetical protein
MPTLKIRSPNDNGIDYQFRSSGPIQNVEDAHENVEGNTVEGHLSTGNDKIAFDGVPTSFTASDPWELDLWLNMGVGFTDMVPSYLNAAEIEVRSEGAHYMLSVPAPGMLLRGGKADKPDTILTPNNTIACGNVRGGADSYRVWPPLNVSGIADNPAEFNNHATDEGWQQMTVVKPALE